jgi:ferrous iron transport protein B
VRPLEFLKNALTGRVGCGCDACPVAAPDHSRTVMLIGSPNVGKSVVFNSLTGRYAVVSNYPGTTVEVSRGRARIGDALVTIIDSPGAYSLAPFSEDERVTQQLLTDEKTDLVIHVLDAKNLRRMLPLTFQLIEAGLPLALDVNMIDEAERGGFTVLVDKLAEAPGLPLVASAATEGTGIDRLRELASQASPKPSTFEVEYPGPIEEAVQRIGDFLDTDYGIAPRAVALLLLQREGNTWERVSQRDPSSIAEIERIVAATEGQYQNPLSYPIAVSRQRAADRMARRAVSRELRPAGRDLRETLGVLAMHPIAGIPILLAVLYFGLYQFVGRLGAGVVVDFLEQRVFEQAVNPVAIALVERLLPWELARALFVGEYGLITLGLRYAFGIVLPLVAAFFLMFAVRPSCDPPRSRSGM